MNKKIKKVQFFSFIENTSYQKEILSFLKNSKLIETYHLDPLVIVTGGDGTFLAAMKEYKDYEVNLLFLNYGHLGFLSNLKEIQDILQVKKPWKFQRFNYLSLETKNQKYYAINEFFVQKLNTSTLFSVSVNETFLYSYFGTGAYISSSLGSSGLNRSLGGPLLLNDDLMCFAEFAPAVYNGFNSLKQPLILGKQNKIKLEIEKVENTFLKIDGQAIDLNSHTIEIEIKSSKAKILNPFELKNRLHKIQTLLIKD